jgi:hypothetical protein
MAKIRELNIDYDDAAHGGPEKAPASGFIVGMIIGAAIIVLGIFVSTRDSAEVFGVDAPHASAQMEQSRAEQGS